MVWTTAPGRSSHVRSDKYVMGYTATLALGLGRLLSIFPLWNAVAMGSTRYRLATATSQHRTG